MTRHTSLTASLWTRDSNGDNDQLAEIPFAAPFGASGRLDLNAMIAAALAAVDYQAPIYSNSTLSVYDGATLLAKRTAYHGKSSWTFEGAALRRRGRLALRWAA